MSLFPSSVSLGGFDASRGVGDVCTALCLPTQRLSDEGSMAVESVLFSGHDGLCFCCPRMCGGSKQLSQAEAYSIGTPQDVMTWPKTQVLGGFESGRVAVFRSFFPDDFVSETGDKKIKKTLEEACSQHIDFIEFHGEYDTEYDSMPTHKTHK